jgi:CO dehydrogenase nickel-insertion accessory protein CooC1
MKKKLTINVCGEAGSGKSRLTFILKKFLKDNGFEVEHSPLDFVDEDEFDKEMNKNHKLAIDNLKENRKIVINELYVKRESNS